MYSRSRRTHSRKSVTLLRPLTCQRQVSPGLTLKRRRWAGSSNRSTSSTGSGRGPTRLISPRSTFKSWGNSSMLYLRSRRPIGVMRGSLVTLKTGPAISFKVASSCLRCSASLAMERNLIMVKGCPFNPQRCCRKRIGPGEVRRMAMAAKRKAGESKIVRIKAPVRSMACLKNPCQEASGAVRKTSTGRP